MDLLQFYTMGMWICNIKSSDMSDPDPAWIIRHPVGPELQTLEPPMPQKCVALFSTITLAIREQFLRFFTLQMLHGQLTDNQRL